MTSLGCFALPSSHIVLLMLSSRFDTPRLVVGRPVHSSAHGVRLHSIVGVGLEKGGERSFLFEARIEPPLVIIGMEDDRHAVIDLAHEVVSLGSDDSARADLIPISLPDLPQPREGEG